MNSKQDPHSVKVGMVQMRVSPDRAAHFDKVAKHVEQCVKEGAQIVCLQELSFDPYFCQEENHDFFQLAEGLDGEISRYSSDLARRNGIVLLTGLFERRAPGIFHNSFLVFEKDGSLAGVYRKTHIPDDPFFMEKFFFTPGENEFPTFDTSVGKLGICICWDQWFPEASRLTAMGGAQIIFYPTAIGWLAEDKEDYGQSQLEAWKTMMRSHAIANGVFVCAPNRVGRESAIEFWGNSFVCDPYGNFLFEGDTESEISPVVELNLDLCEVARTHWPFFRDRRVDLYGDLNKKWR